jgi:NTE family protein
MVVSIQRSVAVASIVVGCAACAAPLRRVPKVAPLTAGHADASPGGIREAGRPTVGVAFGGGSARGIAHVGVIRWLEEHRIPIDVAAGTSMGGLVGGAFAGGMDARELQAFITALDWDQLFGMSTFTYKNIRHRPTPAPIRAWSSA